MAVQRKRRVRGWFPDGRGGRHGIRATKRKFCDLVAALHRGSGDGGSHHRVHNGKKFIPVYVTENMVGTSWASFSFTRNFKGHSMRAATEVAAKPAGIPEVRERLRPRPRRRRRSIKQLLAISFLPLAETKSEERRGERLRTETRIWNFAAEMRYLRVSPQKARLVLELIKGRKVEEARNNACCFTKARGGDVGKLLQSALDNANFLSAEKNLDIELDKPVCEERHRQ